MAVDLSIARQATLLQEGKKKQVAVQRAMRTYNETTSIQVKQREVSKRCLSEVSIELILQLTKYLERTTWSWGDEKSRSLSCPKGQSYGLEL